MTDFEHKKPLVSIGVFLHNEDRFLRESLASLQAQDYPNLEIVVSDNCSTDHTDEICRQMGQGDPRINYERQEQNIGVAANSIRVLERANGKYFMWASGHDLWSPNLVSACVVSLQEHPDAALAYASSSWIDSDGQPLDKESGWYDTRGMDPSAGRRVPKGAAMAGLTERDAKMFLALKALGRRPSLPPRETEPRMCSRRFAVAIRCWPHRPPSV